MPSPEGSPPSGQDIPLRDLSRPTTTNGEVNLPVTPSRVDSTLDTARTLPPGIYSITDNPSSSTLVSSTLHMETSPVPTTTPAEVPNATNVTNIIIHNTFQIVQAINDLNRKQKAYFLVAGSLFIGGTIYYNYSNRNS